MIKQNLAVVKQKTNKMELLYLRCCLKFNGSDLKIKQIFSKRNIVIGGYCNIESFNFQF